MAHPLTRGLDIDDPSTTLLRRTIIQGKPFLRKIYAEWYRTIALQLPDGSGSVLELGSGAGFLGDYVPGLITSEVFTIRGVHLVLDGQALPFATGSLRAIVMNNVLHHLPQAERFLQEATRCLRPGGVISMIEPWVSPWSRLVYGNLHHEPFSAEEREWGHTAGGPLSGANSALPWIIFKRDRATFDAQFPELTVLKTIPLMPFRYLLSGGVSMRTFMPAFTFPMWRWLERGMEPWMDRWAMFALVVVAKETSPRHGEKPVL